MKPLEDQLQTIIDTIPLLAWAAAADGSAEFFNKRWLDYTGLSVGSARNTGWMVAIHPDDLDQSGRLLASDSSVWRARRD